MRYVAYLHKEKDTEWGISFPDFPGCISLGSSADVAIANGTQALSLHVEGMAEDGLPVPRARDLDEILSDKSEVQASRDARIAYVPLLRDLGSPKRVNISMDPGLLAAIDDEAAARKMTRSAFLASAARHEIEGRN